MYSINNQDLNSIPKLLKNLTTFAYTPVMLSALSLFLPSLCRFLSLTTRSMDLTVSGRSLLNRLKYSSSMNTGKGAFQRSCLWFASPPNYLGFIPNSRAIWMCIFESRNFFFASIHFLFFSALLLIFQFYNEKVQRMFCYARNAENLKLFWLFGNKCRDFSHMKFNSSFNSVFIF